MIEKCNATIVFGDDYGDNQTTFHCVRPKGHEGKHAENGVMHDCQPYILSWTGEYKEQEDMLSDKEVEEIALDELLRSNKKEVWNKALDEVLNSLKEIKHQEEDIWLFEAIAKRIEKIRNNVKVGCDD